MRSIFIDLPRIGLVVSCRPVIVISYHTLFVPFVHVDSINNLFTQVLSPFQPIPLQNATPMIWIAAEAALGFLWENNVPLPICNQILAGSRHIGRERITEFVVLAVDSIQTRAIVSSIIVEDPIDFGSDIGQHKLLIEGLLEAFGPDWWVHSNCQDENCRHEIQSLLHF